MGSAESRRTGGQPIPWGRCSSVSVRRSRLEARVAGVTIVSTYFLVDTIDELIKRNHF